MRKNFLNNTAIVHGIEMTDEELLAVFLREIAQRGLTIEQAVKKVGIGQSTFYHWQRIGRASKRGRAAMLVFIQQSKQVGLDEPLFLELRNYWQKFSTSDKYRVLSLAAELAEKAAKIADQSGDRR